MPMRSPKAEGTATKTVCLELTNMQGTVGQDAYFLEAPLQGFVFHAVMRVTNCV